MLMYADDLPSANTNAEMEENVYILSCWCIQMTCPQFIDVRLSIRPAIWVWVCWVGVARARLSYVTGGRLLPSLGYTGDICCHYWRQILDFHMNVVLCTLLLSIMLSLRYNTYLKLAEIILKDGHEVDNHYQLSLDLFDVVFYGYTVILQIRPYHSLVASFININVTRVWMEPIWQNGNSKGHRPKPTEYASIFSLSNEWYVFVKYLRHQLQKRLIRCGLVTPYVVIKLSGHCFRYLSQSIFVIKWILLNDLSCD